MKICLISHSARKGGAEIVLLETVEALTERNVECCVLLPAEGELSTELARRGIPFEIIPYSMWMTRAGTPFLPRLKTAIRIAATVIPVAIKIRKWKCDLIFSNTATVCVGAFASFFLGKPHIWHIHEFGYEDHQLTFLFGKILPYKIMNYLSRGWISNSHVIQKKWGQFLDISKSQVIYYSMNYRRAEHAFHSTPPFHDPALHGAFRCVIVGTLFSGKGQHDAVRAIGELARCHMDVELLVIGKGDSEYQRQLIDLVTEHAIQKQVRFIGHVDDPLPFLLGANVALVCSRAEAFGRVTIEAMLAGKPVIGARSGATQELIREGFNGLFYTPGDPKQLAEKIAFFYHNRTLCEKWGQNGKEWAEGIFTKERYSLDLFSFLDSLNGGSRIFDVVL